MMRPDDVTGPPGPVPAVAAAVVIELVEGAGVKPACPGGPPAAPAVVGAPIAPPCPAAEVGPAAPPTFAADAEVDAGYSARVQVIVGMCKR
jgi:hypothetical protein